MIEERLAMPFMTATLQPVRRLIHDLLRHINYFTRLRIRGVDLRIPTIHGVKCQSTDPWMIDLLERILPLADGRFLDVGVNVGQTLVKVKALAPDAAYIGFEPNPTCVAYVQELIALNHFTNCSIYPVGLYTTDSILQLDVAPHCSVDSSASLVRNLRKDGRVLSQILVPVFSLASCEPILGAERIAMVKIDVEGAELEVLTTLRPRIALDRPLVLLEILPIYTFDNIDRVRRQEAILSLIAEEQYALYRIAKMEAGHFRALLVLSSIEMHSDLNLCDYLMVPKEMVEKITKVF